VRYRYLKTAAGPDGTFAAGAERDLSPLDAKELLADGAIEATETETDDRRETATKDADEKATDYTREKRTKQR